MDNAPFTTSLPTQLVETAVQELIELMRQRYNSEVDRINAAYAEVPGVKANVSHIPLNSYHISEVIEPLMLPACFVIAERSEQDLSGAQNFEHGVHTLLMVLLHSDIEITRMVRATWRMAVAAYRSVHDKAYNNSYFYVRGFDYSPLYRRAGGDANSVNFAKDVVVRVEAHTRESF